MVDFNRVWASAGPVSVPGVDGVEDGHGTVVPPSNEWENWWKNRVDVALQTLQRRGVMEWDTNAPYQAGANVWHAGEFYQSRVATTGQNPSTSPSAWRRSPAPGRVPVGTLGMWPAASPPVGALVRDGTAISRTTYAALFGVIGTTFGAGNGSSTFNLPDDRGLFERGLDLGAGIDAGRTLGSEQLDAFQGHNHAISQAMETPQGGSQNLAGRIDPLNSYRVSRTRDDILENGSYGTPRIASETRGRNRAYTPIIWAF